MLTNQILAKTFQTVKDSVSDSFRVPSDQIPRVFFHGFILAWIIAAFWLLDSLKDPILVDTVGIEYQPYAKFLSVITYIHTYIQQQWRHAGVVFNFILIRWGFEIL